MITLYALHVQNQYGNGYIVCDEEYNHADSASESQFTWEQILATMEYITLRVDQRTSYRVEVHAA